MNSLHKVSTIAKYTFKELVKSRILFVTLFIGVALILVTYVATEFTYGVPQKVALDFGLGMLSLSSLGISIFMGANLLSQEIDSRTVYMVVSRPVQRWMFILGKILGLIAVLSVNILILSILTLGVSLLLGGSLNEIILWSIFLNLLESILLLLLVVFLSLFMNPILSGIVSLAILFSGHAVRETQSLTFAAQRPWIQSTLEAYHLVLPGFYKLNLKDFVIYQQSLPSSYYVSAFGYGLAYSLALLFAIIYIFERKNLD